MLISWNEKYETGIEEIDKQHKTLFKIAESLYAAKEGEEKELGQSIDKTADEFLEYVKYHFKTEESLMEKCCFKGLDEHKRVHKEFEEKAISYQARIKEESGDMFLAMEMMNFLIDWIIGHILVMDREYVECVKNGCTNDR